MWQTKQKKIKATQLMQQQQLNSRTGAHGKFRNGNHIHFGQWKVYTKEAIVGIQRAFGTVQGKGPGTRFARWRKHGYQYTVIRHGRDAIEFTHTHGQQVRGHFRCIHKCDRLFLQRFGFQMSQGHVGEDLQMRLHRQGDPKHGLGRGFIDTGKATSSIERFKLRRCHDFSIPIHVGVTRTIETGPVIEEKIERRGTKTTLITCQQVGEKATVSIVSTHI